MKSDVRKTIYLCALAFTIAMPCSGEWSELVNALLVASFVAAWRHMPEKK